MKRIIEELLKKSKNITPETKQLFTAEVNEAYQNKQITPYDRYFLLEAAEYFLFEAAEYFLNGVLTDIESNRLSWAQGYIKAEDDGKIELYAGRLGYGYIKHIRSEKSTRYHLIEYHIITY